MNSPNVVKNSVTHSFCSQLGIIPHNHLPFWTRVSSYFYPVLLERVQGELPHTLEVRLYNGRLILDSSEANYSFGNLHTLFEQTLRIHPLDPGDKKALILGFGAGSIENILGPDFEIVGVEKDSKVIELYKKWFSPGNSRLIHGDALKYLESNPGAFDVIFVDLFIDTHVVTETLTTYFIDQIYDHLRPGGKVYWNTMELERTTDLHLDLMKRFETVTELEPVKGNTVFYLERGESAEIRL